MMSNLRNPRFRWWARIGLAALGVCAVVATIAAVARPPSLLAEGSQKTWPTLSAATDRPLAVFIGGSAAAGRGATSAAAGWASVVSTTRGWNFVDLAQAEGGYVTPISASNCTNTACGNNQMAATEAVALKPNIVVVSGGEGEQDESIGSLNTAITSTFQTLRGGLPDALIIAVGPMSLTDTADDGTLSINAMVQAAAAAAGATFVNLIAPVNVLQPSMLTANSLDINDAGHAAIAARVASALQ